MKLFLLDHAESIRDSSNVLLGFYSLICTIMAVKPELLDGRQRVLIFTGLGVLIFNMVFIFVANKKAKTIAELLREIDEHEQTNQEYQKSFERIRNLYQNYAANLAMELKLSDHERISIYKKEEKNFSLIARYAKNPFHDCSGRPMYPLGEGCIGQALQRGEYYIVGLPDYNRDMSNYIEEQEKYGLSKEVISKLSMKSRSYAAYAIEKNHTKRIGIVLIESDTTRNKEYFEGKIEIIKNNHNNMLVNIIETTEWQPRNKLKSAEERGF